MTSFVRKSWEEIELRRKELASAILTHNSQELVLQALDLRPKIPGETSISLATWRPAQHLARIYYCLPSITDILPVLEWAERCFGGEFDSTDDDGTRRYTLVRDAEFGLDLTIIVTPDENAENSTCRRVLIGEDTQIHTVRTPKYKIVCDGEKKGLENA